MDAFTKTPLLRCLHSTTLGTVCKCPKKAVVVDW